MHEYRVYVEILSRIKGIHFETYYTFIMELKAPAHLGLPSVGLLVDIWSQMPDLSVAGSHDQISLWAEVQRFRAFELEPYLVGIGSGPDHEVILEILSSTVENQVYPWVYALVPNLSIVRDSHQPFCRIGSSQIGGA